MNLQTPFRPPAALDEQITVRLTAEQISALDAFAGRHGLTRAQAVRKAIGTALIVEHNATSPTLAGR